MERGWSCADGTVTGQADHASVITRGESLPRCGWSVRGGPRLVLPRPGIARQYATTWSWVMRPRVAMAAMMAAASEHRCHHVSLECSRPAGGDSDQRGAQSWPRIAPAGNVALWTLA